MEVSLILGLLSLLLAVVIGLGRQVVVFTAWEPGLWIFQRYLLKRNIGLVIVSGLLLSSWFLGNTLAILYIAVGILSLLSLIFRLEWLFPSLGHVEALSPEKSNLDNNTMTMVVSSDYFSTGESDKHIVRAYALEKMIIARHLVHDTLASTPIVLTYCALCRSGLAFKAIIYGNPASFSVVGVFRRNLIMEDSLTNSLWQQATGMAIYGEKRGSTLELLPTLQLTFGTAKVQFGSALTVAGTPSNSRPAPFASDLGFSLLQKATNLVTVPGHTKLAGALTKRATVFGVELNGQAKAYPLDECKANPTFTDTLGGVDLQFTFDTNSNTLTVTRSDEVVPPVIEQHWWLGWKEFHPETLVWQGKDTLKVGV
jgi:hypothetical protein